MNYVTERALYYTFLMQEICENGNFWAFVSERFGVDQSKVKDYGIILSNPLLSELSSLGDIEIHKNYLKGFGPEGYFGKAKREQDVIDVKARALIKTNEIFGEDSVKGGRLRTLSHTYERSRAASVLYALVVLFYNETDGAEFAENLLMKELKEESNSDAGLILLNVKADGREEIVRALCGSPDMLVCPDVLKKLTERFGGGTGLFKGKRTIGFGGGDEL